MTIPARLADVARLAGVSLATASRALHGARGRSVAPELRARVAAAAAELRYVPNAAAQTVSRGSSNSLGLVVHDIADPFAAAIASSVMAAAAARGHLVLVTATAGELASELEQLSHLHQQRAHGVILAGPRSTDLAHERAVLTRAQAYVAGGGRVVTIGGRIGDLPAVQYDQAGGAQNLAQTLYAQGYRRFALLAGSEELTTSEERSTGFQAGLRACGITLPPENVVGASMTRNGGYVAMIELLDRGLDPERLDAVFAVTDVMAVGAITALAENGYRVPQDLAIAGFEDVGMLRDIRPPLSTVRVPAGRIGVLATELVLGSQTSGLPVLGCEVVIRASTPALGTDR